MDAAQLIIEGKGYLGIEFGSTRIKAVLVDKSGNVLASGGHSWENRYEDGVWTYSLNDIWDGLQDCYKDLKENVKKEYGVTLKHLDAIGFSAMMHGYLAFDENDTILVPFRTWRNTITEEAASKLTAEFNYNIPQRWSIAHLYQAILNGEEHVPYVDFFKTHGVPSLLKINPRRSHRTRRLRARPWRRHSGGQPPGGPCRTRPCRWPV